MIPAMLAPQNLKAFPETPAGMLLNQDVDSLDNFNITIITLRCPVIGRPRKADATAASLHRQVMLGNQIRNSVALLRRP
jgi:hypothetical protein